MGPIDYGSLLQQLDVSPLLNGLQVRNQRDEVRSADRQRQAQVQLAREQFDAKQQHQAGYLAALKAWRDGGGNPQGLRDLALQYPDESEGMVRAADSYEAGAKRSIITDVSSVLGALGSNNPQLALSTLQDRRTALANGGVDTSHTDAAIQMIRSGDVAGARAFLGYSLGGLIGWDHAAGVMETLGIGAKADAVRADDARADRDLDHRIHHDTVMEGQGAARVSLSRAAGARAAARGSARGGARGSRPPAGFVLD